MFNFSDVNEPVLRLGAFVGMFAAMASLEWLRPKRIPRFAKAGRWSTNLTIVALGALVVRALIWLSSLVAVPLAAVVAADYAANHDRGVLNAWIGGPVWAKTLGALIVLDLAIYLQHVASHKIPLLWQLHQMHHADVDFDVTTALRFHPVEIGLSMLYKVVWVLALGPSVLAVTLFEVTLNACAMFNHANVNLPERLEKAIRPLIVTPDMHRIHHSVHRDEHNTNYGFNLSIWDRLFGTYTHAPCNGQKGMTIGLPPYQHQGPTQLAWSLLLPFTIKQPPSDRS